MKVHSALLCGGTAILLLSGCASYGGRGDHYSSNYANSAYAGGYYDGYYGPYRGGYWADDGHFYFLNQNQRYQRDNGEHFRHNPFPGSNRIRTEYRNRERPPQNYSNQSPYDQQDGHGRNNPNDNRQ